MSRRRINVQQLLETCSHGDAIGNLTFYHRDRLRKTGFTSEIYARRIHPDLEGKARPIREYYEACRDEDIIIYHLSIGSEVSHFVRSIPNRMILYYHNITPPHFFKRFHDVLMLQCTLGSEELKGFVTRTQVAVADSDFNGRELRAVGFDNVRNVPVPLDFEKFKRPGSPLLKGLYNDGRTNLLYVGRIIPNKKIEDVIRLFHLYRLQHNRSARLLLAGSYASFETYYHYLWRLAGKLGERENVVFTGHVSEDDLVAYYKIAHVFLMMSEHEGFCVPLIEAFWNRVPVIAYNGGAVGETMRSGGVLFNSKRIDFIVHVLHKILSDSAYRGAILQSQAEALARYKKDIKKITLSDVVFELSGVAGTDK